MKSTIRVLIADDNEVMRATLGAIFAADPRFEVLEKADDAWVAVELARQHQPDVALLDVMMPGGGTFAAREIALCSPGTRVLAHSAHGDLETVLQMFGAGAMGYVVKGSAPAEIRAAVLHAAAGESVLSPEVAASVVQIVAADVRRQAQAAEVQALQRARIESAVRLEGVRMAYQSIWNLNSHEVVGYEALARFSREPLRTPDLWFSEAEEVGLAIELETAVARLAMEVTLPEGRFLALNASAAAILAGALEHLPVNRGGTVLEVTEHASVADYRGLAACLANLRQRGWRVAIDDAGAGHSSMRHILELAPDIIKLDLSIIHGLDTDNGRRAMVSGLVGFANATGAQVIAEGIETPAELDVLVTMGVAWGQGYLLGRPVVYERATAVKLEQWPEIATERADASAVHAGNRSSTIYTVRAATDAGGNALLHGLRALLSCESTEDVVAACAAVVRELGGAVLPARLAGTQALPMDLSFGSGEPVLAVAPNPQVRTDLESVLADLLEDARKVVVRVRQSRSLAHFAYRDGLTGLLNRRELDRLLSRLAAGDVLVMLDIDRFKEINDEFGHSEGDLVLTSLARVLRESVRARDWAGRMGGDEFLLLLPQAKPESGAKLVARIRASWERVRPQPVTISAGIARSRGSDAEQVLARADKALYADKGSRRRDSATPGAVVT